MTTPTHAAPWTLRRFLAQFKASTKRTKPLPAVLTGREAVARALYGESENWAPRKMDWYDASPLLRGGWLAEADRRIAAPVLPLSEILILRWYGYTPAEWVNLPALVQVDKREGYYQARGLGA